MEIIIILKFFLITAILLANTGIIFLFFFNKKNPHDRKYIFAVIFSLVILVLFFLIRAYLKNFFPFTDKIESFTVLFFLLMATSLLYRNELKVNELITLFVIAIIFGLTVFIFNDKIKYPSPFLRTIWFPLHVPLSFSAYAFWIISGVRSIFILLNGNGDSNLVTEMNRKGFIVFTIAMIFGGIWGYLAWGAYFMWDPKVLWSVILWVHYGNLLHIDSIVSFRKIKHPLYALGILLILVTFIGTGFFTRSIHRF